MENKKKCTKCGKELPLDRFYVRKETGRYRAECKECHAERCELWRGLNQDYINDCIRYKRHENPDYYNAICKRYRDRNKEKRRIVCTKWRKANPEKNNLIQKKSRIKRRGTSEGKLNHCISVGMNTSLRGNKRGRKWELWVGCSLDDLKMHIEMQFTDGMTWDRYLSGEIHIDHIIPLSYFDMSDPEQQKRAWHYTNLQPLWAKDNIRKSNKIIEQQLVLL